MANLRIVIDTNVLVSGVAYPRSIPGNILKLWHLGGIDVVLSRYIVDEMVRVLPRLPQNRRSPEQIRDLAESFTLLAEIVEPSPDDDPDLRDDTDLPVLNTLRASNADYLITGDKDLRALADRYPIVTPAAFWTRHGI